MNGLIVCLSLALFCSVQCQAATAVTPQSTHHHHHHSHAPKTTSEPGEKESARFRYDGHTGHLVVRIGDECFLMSLSDAQKSKVHDPIAIKTVEADALKLIGDNVVTAVDAATIDHFTTRDCRGTTKIVQLTTV